MKPIVRILLWIWQLPQNILGVIYGAMLLSRSATTVVDRRVLYIVVPSFKGGISLGQYVIVNGYFLDKTNTWLHEYGHCRQSAILGPLYLLAIGLPSLIWAALYKPEKGNYYDFYTEKWADKLGGVNRNN